MKNLGKIILTIVIIFILAIGIGILYHGKKVNTTQNENIAELNENDKIKIASYETENEKMSFNIPEKWNYEILNLDKEDESHYYGIQMYPNEGEKDKCVVVYSLKQSLGVCGTGLTTKEIETNNKNKASVGYFDNHQAWDYIAYQLEDVNLVAYNKGLEQNEAIEALEILRTLQYEKKTETDNNTFEMTIKEGTLTTTSATVIIKNKNKDSFGTDAWF